jgi:hypothetical protein
VLSVAAAGIFSADRSLLLVAWIRRHKGSSRKARIVTKYSLLIGRIP